MATTTAHRRTGGCCRDAAVQHERSFQLADIRRGASLSDVRVQVTVAHTRSRLHARFFVEMAHVDAVSSDIAAKWSFGVAMSEVKAFETRLLHVIKRCRVHDADGDARANKAKLPFWKKTGGGDGCAMCGELRREVKRWEKFSRLEAIGKRHMDAKCTLVTRFFYRLFSLVHTRAQWLRDCALLREILRMTEELCRVQYVNDSAALCAIESLKRVPSLTRISCTSAAAKVSAAHEECAICLSSLHELSSDGAASSTLSEAVPARDAVELGCGHRFHDTCVCIWFHSRLNCPVCRSPAVSVHADAA